MDMISMEDREMLAIRMTVAVGICNDYPLSSEALITKEKVIFGDDVKGAMEILRILMELEPVIRKVLELYYQ